MFRWLDSYNKASTQTKYFVLNWLVHGLAIVITAVYCYARLDFVRSYRTPSIAEGNQKTEQIKNKEQNDTENSRISPT